MTKFTPDKRQFIWSASSLDALMTCPRKYYYTRLQGYRAKSPSVDLVFGKLFSQAVERFHTQAQVEPDDALERTVEAAMRDSAKQEVLRTEQLKTRKALINAIVGYVDRFAADDVKFVHKTEEHFHVELTDEIMLEGVLDVVSYDPDSDDFKINDQKTTKSTLSPRFFTLFTPSNQMSLYIYAGRTIFPRPVRHVMVDAVQITKTGTNFLRGVVSRTPGQLDEWAAGILTEIHRAWERDPNDEATWPQNPTACGYFRGCEFRHVCSEDPKIRPSYLKQDFVVDHAGRFG